MALTALILLSIYTIAITCVLLAPVKQRDPQMGMAVGCLMLVLVGLLAVGGLLALGYFLHQTWLVRGVFWFTVFPGILLLGNAIAYPFVIARRRREAARWSTSSEPPKE